MNSQDSRRIVCLLSNNCLDVFPQNNRTNFANVLAIPIHNRNNSSFFIRLRAVGIAINQFKGYHQKPRYIKVQLEELEDQISGLRSTNQTLGGIDYPPKAADADLVRQDYIYCTVKGAPYLRLKFSTLQKLQVLITDEWDRRFSIGYGAPTIIVCEILAAEAMGREGNFTITCFSKQPETFAHNALHRFTCPLPETLELNNYEVAVTNIIYPVAMYESCVAQLMVENEVYSYDLYKFKNANALLYKVNSDLRTYSAFRKELQFVSVRAKNIVGRDSFHMALKRKKLKPEEDQKSLLSVRMNYIFSFVLGEMQNNPPLLMMKPGERIEMGHRGQPPNLEFAIPSPVALLLCDAVESSWIGAELQPFLSCVPVRHDSYVNFKLGGDHHINEYANWTYQPEHPQYVDVKRTPFDSISFSFRNPGIKNLVERVFIPKRPETDTMLITLVFRPKK